MATRPIRVRLTDDLARRLQRSVPAGQRSAYVQWLLEDALPREDDDADPLQLAALEVERDHRLASEMSEWDVAAAADGLADHPYGDGFYRAGS